MVDQNSQFFAILTNVGAAKQANADALGIPWKITQMGVGDANGADPTPSAAQTRLINEWRRAPLNLLKVDDKDASVIVAEQVIPADVGGHWIREIALYDADGDMVAVANCAPTYKPLLSQGSGRTQVVRMNLIVSSSSNVQLKIDPSVVLATREYVDTAILSVLPKNKAAGTYTKVTIDERGIVLQGANPTTLAGFGIQDTYTKTAIDNLLSSKANNQDVYSKVAVDSALSGKANNAITLAGYGITDAYTKVEINTALSGKANKASTLAGYGITDAIPNVNPLPYGSYDLHGTNYAFVTSQLESSVCQNAYWDGVDWKKHDTSKVSIAISAHSGRAYVRTWAVGAQAYTSSQILDTSMEASIPDLDAGVTPAKWVSVAGLAYYVSSKLKAASETIAGYCRFATLNEVVTGASGYLAVAPAYLVAGFSYTFGGNGFIKFPTWLGGFMIQWAYSDESSSATDYRYFPVPFPSVVFGSWLQLGVDTINGFAGSYGTIVQVVDNTRYAWTAGGTFGGGGKGWIFAIGR
ncbi:phage tail protein [Pseudomonas sp. CAM1A]|uniref:phage tail protein n=1 Tax=Pseudomonas sp. CAM1A TaxID=3231717 RepID=UPI0039C6B487